MYSSIIIMKCFGLGIDMHGNIMVVYRQDDQNITIYSGTLLTSHSGQIIVRACVNKFKYSYKSRVQSSQ